MQCKCALYKCYFQMFILKLGFLEHCSHLLSGIHVPTTVTPFIHIPIWRQLPTATLPTQLARWEQIGGASRPGTRKWVSLSPRGPLLLTSATLHPGGVPSCREQGQ